MTSFTILCLISQIVSLLLPHQRDPLAKQQSAKRSKRFFFFFSFKGSHFLKFGLQPGTFLPRFMNAYTMPYVLATSPSQQPHPNISRIRIYQVSQDKWPPASCFISENGTTAHSTQKLLTNGTCVEEKEGKEATMVRSSSRNQSIGPHSGRSIWALCLGMTLCYTSIKFTASAFECSSMIYLLFIVTEGLLFGNVCPHPVSK